MRRRRQGSTTRAYLEIRPECATRTLQEPLLQTITHARLEVHWLFFAF